MRCTCCNSVSAPPFTTMGSSTYVGLRQHGLAGHLRVRDMHALVCSTEAISTVLASLIKCEGYLEVLEYQYSM